MGVEEGNGVRFRNFVFSLRAGPLSLAGREFVLTILLDSSAWRFCGLFWLLVRSQCFASCYSLYPITVDFRLLFQL